MKKIACSTNIEAILCLYASFLEAIFCRRGVPFCRRYLSNKIKYILYL